MPKVSNSSTCHDFRPIACYNRIYKCISKIIANGLKGIFPNFINKTRTSFVGGRHIGDNIHLCHELLHNYLRNPMTKSVQLKWI